MPPVIRCQNLVKTYEGRPPVEAVRGLDLEVAEGECFGLLGPNGAGKTTTIEIMEGLLAPTSGNVEVLGRQWGKDDDAIRQRIGISFQETKLSEKLSVRETLDAVSQLLRARYRPEAGHGASRADRKSEELGRQALGRTESSVWPSRAPWSAIRSCCFSTNRRPASIPNRDASCGRSFADYRQQGRTILLTTHYLDEAERLCDHVAIVDRGKVIAQGTPRELIVSLGGEHVIEFTLGDDSNGAANDISGELDLFSRLPTVQSVHADHGRICLSVGEPHRTLPALLNTLEANTVGRSRACRRGTRASKMSSSSLPAAIWTTRRRVPHDDRRDPVPVAHDGRRAAAADADSSSVR